MCVSVRGCETQRDVVGIKYKMCFVCVLEWRGYRFVDEAVGW